MDDHQAIHVKEDILCIENSLEKEDDKFCILHLSDLHFGKHHEDICELNNSTKLDLAELIKETLGDLKPHAVVISGDISTANDRKSFDDALSFLKKLKTKLELEASQFIIVPGNHDIDRNEGNYRLNNFLPFIKKFYNFSDDLTEKKFNNTGFSIFNKFKDIVFLGFDSTLVNQDFNDWGYISLQQRKKFEKILSSSKNSDQHLLKIAVCHHHLLPIAKKLIQKINDEPNVSLLYDSAAFIEWLIKYDFSICLHGHHHLPYILTELRNDLNPENLEKITFNHQELSIIGAGCASCKLREHDECKKNCWNFLVIDKPRGQIDISIFVYNSSDGKFVISNRTTIPIPCKKYQQRYIGSLFERISEALDDRDKLNRILSESLYGIAIKAILTALGVIKRDRHNVICASDESKIIKIHKNLLKTVSFYIKEETDETILDSVDLFPSTQYESFYSPLLFNAHIANKLEDHNKGKIARKAHYILFPVISVKDGKIRILLREHINWGHIFLVPAVKCEERPNNSKCKERLELGHSHFNYAKQKRKCIEYERDKIYVSPSRGGLTKYKFKICFCEFEKVDFQKWDDPRKTNMKWFSLDDIRKKEYLASIQTTTDNNMLHNCLYSYFFDDQQGIFPNNLDVLYKIVKFISDAGKSLNVIWNYKSSRFENYTALNQNIKSQIQSFIASLKHSCEK